MWRSRSLADAFDAKRNALAFLRIVLAALVVWHHTYPIGGYDERQDPLHWATGGRVAIGNIAVCGFFALSGFLVTRSWAARTGPDVNKLVRFLWHRGLRIMPGFWLALAVTVFVLAPIGWLRSGNALGAFPWGAAASFVRSDALLPMHQTTIAGVLPSTGFGDGSGAYLNGSLWTLVYEALCYLLVAGLGVVGLLRRSLRVVPAALLFGVCLATLNFRDRNRRYDFESLMVVVQADTLRFLVAFLAGVVLATWADRIPVSGVLGGGAAAATWASVAWWGWEPWGIVSFSYFVLWSSTVLPITAADRYGDFSYGLYVFAFPVQQLVATFPAVVDAGPEAFVAVSLVATLPLAAGSWHAVERQALRLKDLRVISR